MEKYEFKKLIKKHSEEIEKGLEKIQNIADIEERSSAINFFWWKHSQEQKKILQKKPESLLLNYDPDLKKYKELIEGLWKLSCELSKKNVEERKNNDNNENKDKPEKQKGNNICWECHKTKSEKWFTNPETGLEFCSQACNLEHNAELCEDCVQKCLKYEKGVPIDYQTYYRDNEKKTGILCFACKQKQRKELESELDRLQQDQKADKEELERIKRLIESNDKDDFSIDDDKSNQIKSNQIKSNQIKSNQIKSNQIKSNQIKSNQIKFNLQTLQSNSIQSVELTSEGELLITYQNKPTTALKPTDLATNPNLQKIKNTMVKNNQTKLTKAELEQQLRELEEQRRKLEGDKNQEQKDKDNGLGLKVGIGALVVVVFVSLVVVLVKRSKNNSKY